MIQLEALKNKIPRGAADMLQALGSGQSGCVGTPYGRGEMDFTEYLRRARADTFKGLR
jgi:hypothetical protein